MVSAEEIHAKYQEYYNIQAFNRVAKSNKPAGEFLDYTYDLIKSFPSEYIDGIIESFIDRADKLELAFGSGIPMTWKDESGKEHTIPSSFIVVGKTNRTSPKILPEDPDHLLKNEKRRETRKKVPKKPVVTKNPVDTKRIAYLQDLVNKASEGESALKRMAETWGKQAIQDTMTLKNALSANPSLNFVLAAFSILKPEAVAESYMGLMGMAKLEEIIKPKVPAPVSKAKVIENEYPTESVNEKPRGPSLDSFLAPPTFGDDDLENGPVHVRSYKRADGTRVESHTRAAPRAEGDSGISCWTCGSQDARYRVTGGTGLVYHVCVECKPRAEGDSLVKSIEPLYQPGNSLDDFVVHEAPYREGPITNGLVAGDSMILMNQPLAREGVLGYGAVRKLKRWSDLKNNIGRTVPIVDEHPSIYNGRDGMVTPRTKIWGRVGLKQCPNGKKQLCGDLELWDGAPIKPGYSIGFKFQNVPERGVYEGQEYDSIQNALDIDHVALTDVPRDSTVTMTAGDSKPCPFDQCRGQIYDLPPLPGLPATGTDAVQKYSVGQDSYRFAPPSSPEDPRFVAIASQLKRSNPNTPEDVIAAFAEQIWRNERRGGRKEGTTHGGTRSESRSRIGDGIGQIQGQRNGNGLGE